MKKNFLMKTLKGEEIIKQRSPLREEEEDLLKDDEEKKSYNSSEESSEYEESTDSEEKMAPRLKPVFEPKREGISVTEKAKKAQKGKQAKIEAQKLVEEQKMGVQNKAGAIAVKNCQNMVSMKKVRRVPRSIFSSEEEYREDDFLEKQGRGHQESDNTTGVPEPNKRIEIREEGDSLLRRLMRLKQQGHNDDDDDKSRRRQIREFEVSDIDEISENLRKRIKLDSSESSDEEELSEEIRCFDSALIGRGRMTYIFRAMKIKSQNEI